jgi:glutamine---fructose-6-phosphate transaminase (isomerizing)
MTTAPLEPFDPTAPLAAPPDPWASASPPSLRPGPPYHMTDMIAAEPAVARRIVERLSAADGSAAELAGAIRAALVAGDPVVATGCGTSEHGALAAVEILREAAASVGLDSASLRSEQAFELSLDPPTRGLVIGVSHEGGTRATNAAIAAARAAGARTAMITASRRSPAAGLADIAIETIEMDHSWCHTVGYVSPLVAAAVVGAHLSGRPLDGDAVATTLATGMGGDAAFRAEAIAGWFAEATRLIVIASGADRPAGRELTLKVEEASWLPSAYRDLETFLHGHLPATDDGTGLVLVLTDRQRRAERLARARAALAAARVIGLRAAAIVGAEIDADLDPDLTPAGRMVVRAAPDLPSSVATLLGSVTPLQLMTERIARARGTNPDLIRRDDATYLAASEAAEGG